MSNSETDLLVNQSIKKIYLATCEGDFSTPEETASNIGVLIKKGYVEAIECRRDTRSKHDAKTCRVKMVWLTEKGKEIGKNQTSESYFEVREKLDPFLNSLSPRISVLAKYLLACWSRSIISGKADTFQRRRSYRRQGWNMIPQFEWDLRVPGNSKSLLPESVKNELQSLPTKLVELKLAEWNKTGHNVNGWYESDTLMTIKPIASAILKNYGGYEMPSFIKSLVLTISRAAKETELASQIERGGLGLWQIVDYLDYGSFSDVEEFLKTIEDLEYAKVDWEYIQKHARPRIRYNASSRDEIDTVAVQRNLYGLIPSIYTIAYLRHSMVENNVKKALAEWFETGKLCLEEIPPFRIFWDASKRSERERIQSYLKKMGTSTRDANIMPTQDGNSL